MGNLHQGWSDFLIRHCFWVTVWYSYVDFYLCADPIINAYDSTCLACDYYWARGSRTLFSRWHFLSHSEIVTATKVSTHHLEYWTVWSQVFDNTPQNRTDYRTKNHHFVDTLKKITSRTFQIEKLRLKIHVWNSRAFDIFVTFNFSITNHRITKKLNIKRISNT